MTPRRGESQSAYHSRMRDERLTRNSSRRPSIVSNHPAGYKPTYYMGKGTPRENKNEIPSALDWAVVIGGPVSTVLLLGLIPGLGIIQGGVTAAYASARLYRSLTDSTVGQSLDTFISNKWQQFKKK